MNRKSSFESADVRSSALSTEALKRIVGGARVDDKHNVTPELAIGLTVGAHDAHDAAAGGNGSTPAAETGAKAVSLTNSNIQIGAHGAFEIKVGLEKQADGSVATKFDLTASGVKGKPDTVKITVFNHDTKERSELTAQDVAAQAKAGNSLFTGMADFLKKLDGSDAKQSADYLKNLEKELRGSFKEKVGHSNKSVDPLYTKTVKTLETTTDATGKVVERWETKTDSTALDQQKAAADKAAKLQAEADKVHAAEQAAAKAAQQAAAKAAQQSAIAGSHQAVKNAIDAKRAVPAADAAVDKAMLAKAIADGENRVGAAKEALAKQTYDHALKRFAEANATGSPQAPALKAAVDKAADGYVAAKKVASDAAKAAEKVNADASKATQNLAAAHSAVDASKAALTDTAKAAKTAHKNAQDADARARSNSVPGKPAATQAGHEDEHGGARARSNSTPGQTDTNPAKLAERPDAPKVKKGLMEKTANAIGKTGGKLIQEKAWSAGTKAVNAAVETAAQDLAKKNGTYHKTENSDVLAGGIEKTVTVTGNQTVEHTTIAQVKTEGGTMTFSSELGKGASAQWGIRAEAGVENTTTTDLGHGVSQSVTNKAYAGAAFENEAKAVITKTSASASASTTVSAHAEISHSETTDYGGIKVTDKVGLAADAQAAAKAGVSLGFDGVKAELKASAEASVKATASKEVEVGDVKIKGDLTAFAQAKAEAKADMNVNFNPLSKEGVKVKAGFGAEASAGVGLEGTTGFKGKDGNGADIGGGVYAGKIGVKTDANVGFKDGKLSLEFDVGASLGVGVNIHVKADSNIGKSYSDGWRDIKEGNFGEKVLGGARILSGLGPNFIIGLFN